MRSVTERHTCSVIEIHRYSVTELHSQYAVLQGTVQEILGSINCTRGDKCDAVYQLQRLLGVTKKKPRRGSTLQGIGHFVYELH
jgi:hypothetical protein